MPMSFDFGKLIYTQNSAPCKDLPTSMQVFLSFEIAHLFSYLSQALLFNFFPKTTTPDLSGLMC